MPIVYTIYAIALTYTTTVAIALLLYGAIDHIRHSKHANGIMEAVAGAVFLLYLVVVHFEGLTKTVYREISHGSLVSKSYIILPIVVGVISTDYLLRRIMPLLYRYVAGASGGQQRGPETTGHRSVGSRRSMLGVALGVVTVGLSGGSTVLREMLRSPIPEGNEVSAFQRQAAFEAPYFPTALSFSEGSYAFLTTIEGKIFKFEPPSSQQTSLQFEEVASGIQYPQGVEVVEDTLYTVDNGGTAGGKYTIEEGYKKLQESNGTVIAFDIEADGSLKNKRTIVSKLPVVNSDHALHQITTGPDGRLHLSIGHLGGQKYPELFEDGNYAPSEEDHPGAEYLGTVISFEPDGSDIQIMASGLRNVYDLAFDQQGHLFGANNDGMSLRSKVWESLYHLSEDAYFGYPEYGTFDAGSDDENIDEPLWTLDGVQSTGVETTDKLGYRDGVVVALSSKVVFVPIERTDDAVFVPEFLRPEPTVIELNDSPIIVEAGPDGLLWVGSTGQEDTLSVYHPGS